MPDLICQSSATLWVTVAIGAIMTVLPAGIAFLSDVVKNLGVGRRAVAGGAGPGNSGTSDTAATRTGSQRRRRAIRRIAVSSPTATSHAIASHMSTANLPGRMSRVMAT